MSYIYVNKEDKNANDINLLNEIIQLNEDNEKIEAPTLRLMTRSFRNLGKISHYQNWNISLVGVGLNEISFSVNKYIDGKENPVWNDLVDLKIVNVNNVSNFEIQVDYADNAETIKNVHGVSLETELGQIYLHEFHVNDDEAHENITSDFIPTTFYNVNDKAHSLLHRVLSEAPHWTLDDENITKFIALSEDEDAELCSKFQRMYSVDGTSILDFFNGEVAEQSNVIFIFDTVNRKIGCKSLIDCYVNGQLMEDGIGKDTTILVSKNKLANSIQISSDKDSVKNCFRIVGGDETINDMVRVANVNGSNKIYLFDKFQLDDMTPELKQKITDYQTLLDSERDNYYGENGIYTRLIEQYERLSYLESEMMPTINIDPPQSAEEQFNLLKEKLSNMVVGVSSLSNYDANLYTAITNNVEAIANILIDSRYSIDIVKIPDESPYYICEPTNNKYIWNGIIKVTKVSDKTDFYPKTDEEGNYKESDYFSISIADDTTDFSLPFTRQKIDIALAKGDMSLVDYEATQFGTRDEVYNYFNQYCLNRLKSFVDGYETCVDTLRTGKVESDVKDELLDIYSFRLDIVKQVYDERYLEIYGNDDTKGIVDIIEDIKQEQVEFQDRINFQSFLGEKLYVEFCSYCREDTYSNNNFISDGKESSSELLEVAKELVDNAEKELKKACVLQRTVSVPLNNLLVLPEFKPFYDSFNLFNYILVQTEDELLKLRLIGVDFSGDSVSDINVTFSDQIVSVDREIDDKASIFQQMTTIATNYNSTILQAKQGVEANKELNDIYTNGLNATKAMITNSDDNEVTITKSGILIRRMDDEGHYGLKQARTIGNGFYLTDDAWETLKMAVGEIIYINPITGVQEQAYGVIADTLIGNLIAGKQMHIGNEDGSVLITGDGIELDGGAITWKTPLPSSSVDGLDNYLEQLDGRIQTYSQTEDPSSEWKTADEKNKHVGDIWLNPSDGLTKQWDGTKWIEITDSALKELAESKAQIFTDTPTTPYYVGDLWVQGADGDILNCIQSKLSGSYDSSHWEISSKYTDDTKASEALEKAQQGIKDAAEGISLANKAQDTADTAQTTAENANTRAENAEKNAKDYADEQDSSLSTTLTSAYKEYTNSEVKKLDDSVSDYLGLGGTTIVSDQYMISPYLGGGYLNISSDNKRVIIDPKNLGNTDYIFQVHNDTEISIGMKADGTTNINAHIHAKSLTLGDGVSISSSNIDGIDAYAKTTDIPTNITDLNGTTDILYANDVSISSSTTSSGVTKQSITVGDKTYTSIINGDFIFTDIGLGTNTTDGSKKYTCISSDGLLTAKNAVIYGAIHATEGNIGGCSIVDGKLSVPSTYISGKIVANQIDTTGLIAENISGTTITGKAINGGTITIGSNFSVDTSGNMICSNANVTGNINATSIKASKAYYIYDSDAVSYQPIISVSLDNSSDTKYNFGRLATNGYGSGLNYIAFIDQSQNKSCHIYSGLFEIHCSSNINGEIEASSHIRTDANFIVAKNYGLYNSDIQSYMVHRYKAIIENVEVDHNRFGNADLDTAIIGKNNIYANKSITVYSDERIKCDFETLEKYEKWFHKIQPMSYKFVNGTSNRIHIGISAQSVKQSLIDSNLSTNDFAGYVEMPVDPELQEYINDGVLCGLRYEEFIMLNTHMIQKAYKIIESQQNEINELKTMINQMNE